MESRDQRQRSAAVRFEPFHRAPEDGELVSEGEDLDLQDGTAAEWGRQGREQGCEYARWRERTQRSQLPSDPDFRQPEMDDLLSEVSVSTWAARDDSRHYRIRAYSAFAC